MKKIRYVSIFLNGDIGKGRWIDLSKFTLKDMHFMADLMNCNKFIKTWTVEYK